MTALPRNIAAFKQPVRDGAATSLKRFSYSSRATERGDDFLCHAPLSHTVTKDASPFYHSLCVEQDLLAWHTVGMESQDKNGGPNHLREWRTYRKLSQQQLAEAVGTNANMIQYLETGERGLSAKWLRRLAPALGTTPGMLLDHDPHEMDADILDIWGNASAREKRQISDVARALLRTGTDG